MLIDDRFVDSEEFEDRTAVIGAAMKLIRLRVGKTQVEVCTDTGIPQSSLVDFESGTKNRVSMSLLMRLLGCYGIDAAGFVKVVASLQQTRGLSNDAILERLKEACLKEPSLRRSVSDLVTTD